MRFISTLFAIALAGTVAATPAAAANDCPQAALFEPDASGSTTDSGWTGLNHRRPVFGDTLPLGVSCAVSTPPCGSCTVTGIVPEGGGTRLRCVNDTSLACSVATEVADCGAANTCRVFLSPPQPVSILGVTACYTNEVTGLVGGTIDSDSGDLDVGIPYLGRLFAGGSTPDACPSCVGDPTPNDGLRGGTCHAGPRNGLACDVNGPAIPLADFGASSFDCPASPGALISTSSPGPLALSTTPQTRTLSAANPSCRGPGASGFRCLCDTCNDGAGETCASNADCPPSGGNPGICGGRRCIGGPNAGMPCGVASECPAGSCTRLGEPTQPNACQDDPNTVADESFVCVDSAPVGDNLGECVSGPFDTRCANHFERPCVSDGECDGVPGACTTVARACYLDNGIIGGSVSVSTTATPPVDNVSAPTVLGSLFCQQPSSSSAVNNIVGYPGLARQRHVGRLTFAEEIVEKLVGAGGSATTVGFAPAGDVEATVASPAGGALRIVRTLTTGAPPSGYDPLGRVIATTALDATAASPLVIAFEIAAAAVPPGEDETSIDVFQNGSGPIPNCLHPADAIPNDPCVATRSALGGGAVGLTVLSSTAGDWMLAVEPGPGVCPTTPDVCRVPIASGKASVALTDKSPDTKDRLLWKWLKGAATTKADFGSPTSSDTYALCLYDATGRRASMPIPTAGTCAGKPCWQDQPKGFLYKNRAATPRGITKLLLKSGAAGVAQIQAQGKGDLLPMPLLLSLTPPLQMQLRNSTSGLCWSASFSAPLDKNDGKQLKDRAD